MTNSEQQTHKDWKQFEIQGEVGRWKLPQLWVEKAGTELQKNQTGLWQTHAGHFLFDLTMAVNVCQDLSQGLGFVWLELTAGLAGCANRENRGALVLKQEAALPCPCFGCHRGSSVPGWFSQCGWAPALHHFPPPDSSGRQQQCFWQALPVDIKPQGERTWTQRSKN